MAHILVVDDESDIRDVLKDALEQLGHFVQTATNGREGLQRLMDHPVDLVLLDMRMPVMSGYEMLQSLRTTLRSEVAVLILTGYASLDSMFKCTELGVSGYLPKPFRLDELEGKINSCLAGQLPAPSSLSRATRIKLTAREQEVLLLMRQGWTDQEIADKLYISPNTAHNHVKRIMSKLDCRNRSEVVARSFVEDVFDS
ncbi:MAG: response regulator transcription factor [Armatimonadetes bacterium]|nr:response regulator transcription factor [Armatimonadota bacterium]